VPVITDYLLAEFRVNVEKITWNLPFSLVFNVSLSVIWDVYSYFTGFSFE
jgi:hypothetical protein